MYPGVSSHGMEADPLMFLYLKDEYFQMTEVRYRKVSKEVRGGWNSVKF